MYALNYIDGDGVFHTLDNVGSVAEAWEVWRQCEMDGARMTVYMFNPFRVVATFHSEGGE